MNEKILIIAPSWIGDCIMSQSLFQVLYNTRSNIQIDVYVNKKLIPIFNKMPQVTNIIENPFLHGDIKLFKRFQEGFNLRLNKYTQVIVLPGSLKSALVPFFAKIPIRTGFASEMRNILLNDVRILDKQVLYKMVIRYISLAFPASQKISVEVPVPKLYINKKIKNDILKRFNLNNNRKIVSFCPGAEYGSSKRWPYKHFASLARYFYNKGVDIWIFGSNKDFAIAQNIVRESNVKCINLCGRTTLDEAIYLLGFSDLVICNDSGLMHISYALDIPLISIYGSTSYRHTPPLSKRSKILSLDLDCSPCFKRDCPLGHLNCMNLLSPDLVFKESLKLVNL